RERAGEHDARDRPRELQHARRQHRGVPALAAEDHRRLSGGRVTRHGLRGISGAILAIALLAGAILPNDRALLDAAKRGDLAAVKQALKSGADVNAAQGDGLTALHIAAQEGP